MSNKTSSVFFQKLSRRAKDKDIIKYGYCDQEPGPFFGSFAELFCFLALIVCVCIIIYGLKYVNGDFKRSTKESENPRLPNKPFQAKDIEQQRREQKTFCV